MALVPGPVVTTLFTETIRGGWEKAKRIVFWAAIGEIVISVSCVFLLSFLPTNHVIFSALSIFGALLLFSIAYDLWRVQEIQEKELLFSNQRIFFLTTFNGMAWAFWVTVCSPQAIQMNSEISFGKWVFIILFELGWFISTIALVALFSRFRIFFQSNKKISLLFRTISIFFIFFGLRLGWNSLKNLL